MSHRAGLIKTFEAEDGRVELRAVTGPDYGRIWDHELVAATIRGSQWMAEGQECAVALARQRMGIEERCASRAWHDHIDGDALPLDLALNSRSIATAVEMMRKGRSVSITIAKYATPDKYVELGFLREAQALVGIPEQRRCQVGARRRAVAHSG